VSPETVLSPRISAVFWELPLENDQEIFVAYFVPTVEVNADYFCIADKWRGGAKSTMSAINIFCTLPKSVNALLCGFPPPPK
jgi:hypothetical protein